jgi:hypothetical protein
MVTLGEFEEGDLPRKLFFVAQRTSGETTEKRRAQRGKHDRPERRDERGYHGRLLKQSLGARGREG